MGRAAGMLRLISELGAGVAFEEAIFDLEQDLADLFRREPAPQKREGAR